VAELLARFRAAKQAEIDRLRTLDAAGELEGFWIGERPSFSGALGEAAGRGCAVIAEYKRASPSKGVINLELSVADVARMYAAGGAAAMSVLTEVDHFQGDMAYLDQAARASRLPILRKDFIVDPLQLKDTARTRASAVLLIARLVPEVELRRLVALSAALGLEPVVEIFDEADLSAARGAGAPIIQVNNRDLDTLDIDLNRSLTLVEQRGENELWISASGVTDPGDVAAMARAGFEAVLVGTHLMQQPDPARTVADLVAGGRA
jgi:indole-3-glycerol phosphate synthase